MLRGVRADATEGQCLPLPLLLMPPLRLSYLRAAQKPTPEGLLMLWLPLLLRALLRCCGCAACTCAPAPTGRQHQQLAGPQGHCSWWLQGTGRAS